MGCSERDYHLALNGTAVKAEFSLCLSRDLSLVLPLDMGLLLPGCWPPDSQAFGLC